MGTQNGDFLPFLGQLIETSVSLKQTDRREAQLFGLNGFFVGERPGISLLGASSSDGRWHRPNNARSHQAPYRGRCADARAFEAVQVQSLNRTH